MIVRCINCLGTDSIASVDGYIGTCVGEVIIDKAGELEFEPAGYTEIHWDTCDQIGWQCRNCYAEAMVNGEHDSLDAALKRLVEVIS